MRIAGTERTTRPAAKSSLFVHGGGQRLTVEVEVRDGQDLPSLSPDVGNHYQDGCNLPSIHVRPYGIHVNLSLPDANAGCSESKNSWSFFDEPGIIEANLLLVKLPILIDVEFLFAAERYVALPVEIFFADWGRSAAG
jgi:hypothetical protein